VFPSLGVLHETQSKILTIYGTGFTNVTDVKLTLHPTFEGAYKVIGVDRDSLRVQLMSGESWLGDSSFFSPTLKDENKKMLLTLMDIDMGDGVILLSMPVPVGYIIKDRQGVSCDDSCEFALDGVCDDSSADTGEYYYFNYESHVSTNTAKSADDFYVEGADRKVSGCVLGTDCTDCGVDTHITTVPLNKLPCTNTCIFSDDGVCDDLRGTMYCELGKKYTSITPMPVACLFSLTRYNCFAHRH